MQAKIGMDVQTTTSPVILKNSKLQHENGSETPYNMPINSIQSMGYELFGVTLWQMFKSVVPCQIIQTFLSCVGIIQNGILRPYRKNSREI